MMSIAFIRSTVVKWWHNPYLRAGGVLLPVLCAAFFLMGASCRYNLDFYSFVSADPGASIQPGGSAYWNNDDNKVTRTICANGDPSAASTSVDYEWTPPRNADYYNWGNTAPDNPGGPPPYRWSGLTTGADGRGPEITFSFGMSNLAGGTQDADVFSIRDTASDAMINSSTSQYHFRSSLLISDDPIPVEQLSEIASEIPAIPNQHKIWDFVGFIHSEEIAMTTTLCQELIDAWQAGDYFSAVQVPAIATTSTVTSTGTIAALPIVDIATFNIPLMYTNVEMPILKLDTVSHGIVISVPLEIKPDRMNFVVNEMPESEDKIWFAMGAISTPPLACPTGLDLAPGDWEFKLGFSLDLGGGDSHAGDLIEFYQCYEGQDPPLDFPGGTASLVSIFGANTYQGEGITCFGPLAIRLGSFKGLEILNSHSAVISPTETITFPHMIFNNPASLMTITLETESAMGFAWKLYKKTEPPELITGPFQIENGLDILAVLQAPAGSAGMETVKIKVSSVADPTISAWTSDVLWIGPWSPPPTVEPPSTDSNKLYLPLVLR
jgi:hypothetical protein